MPIPAVLWRLTQEELGKAFQKMTRKEYKFKGTDEGYQKWLDICGANDVSKKEIKSYWSTYFKRNK